MRRPVIGITPDFNPGGSPDGGGSEATIFLRNRYAAAIEAAGAVPVILPIVASRSLCRALLDRLDGLLLTGSGPDIDPRRYQARKMFPFRVMSRERTDSEFTLVAEARKRDLPVLGICGGMQAMNVALGGTLVQDIGEQVTGALSHRMTTPATQVCHPVTVAPGSKLRRILKQGSVAVNSSHHQAVQAVPPALSLSVPPRWNVTSELKAGPSGAPVVQSRGVTCIAHGPTGLSFAADSLDWAAARPLKPPRRAVVSVRITARRVRDVRFDVLKVMRFSRPVTTPATT